MIKTLNWLNARFIKNSDIIMNIWADLTNIEMRGEVMEYNGVRVLKEFFGSSNLASLVHKKTNDDGQLDGKTDEKMGILDAGS